MKKMFFLWLPTVIIKLLLLMVFESAGGSTFEAILQEMGATQALVAELYKDHPTHKAALFALPEAKNYVFARQNWFANNCGDNQHSTTCKQAREALQEGLGALQKTDLYTEQYLPNRREYRKNEYKFHALQHMASLTNQPEQLNPSIESGKDRMVYAINCMKVIGNGESSQLWVEFSQDPIEAVEHAQGELRGFLERIFSDLEYK
jgi:hypothetical protein